MNLHNTVARRERSELGRTVFKCATVSRKSTFGKRSRKILRLSRHQCTDSTSALDLIQSEPMALYLGDNSIADKQDYFSYWDCVVMFFLNSTMALLFVKYYCG